MNQREDFETYDNKEEMEEEYQKENVENQEIEDGEEEEEIDDKLPDSLSYEKEIYKFFCNKDNKDYLSIKSAKNALRSIGLPIAEREICQRPRLPERRGKRTIHLPKDAFGGPTNSFSCFKNMI